MTPSHPTQDTWETAQQFCARFKVCRTTWWRWSQAPGFPIPVRFGRAVRWNSAEVRTFLQQRGQ